jgi:uncharacterized Zn finger protein
MKRSPSEEALKRRHRRLECENCGENLMREIARIEREYHVTELKHESSRKSPQITCPKCGHINSYEEIKKLFRVP